MSVVRPMVPAHLNEGDDVSLTLTWKGVTYDASGLIGDLIVEQDFATGKRTLTLRIEDPTMVAKVRTEPPVSPVTVSQGDAE